jgi:hypothetical protein
LNRFLSKDYLSGVMFIAFGVIALWFGRNLALGTSVRMGPGYVPHTLADIMMVLGTIVALIPLFANASAQEKRAVWIPTAAASVVFIVVARLYASSLGSPWIAQLSSDWLLLLSTTGVLAVLLVSALTVIMGHVHADPGVEVDKVEPPTWRPITMVTIGLIAFALLLEPSSIMPFTGMFPALIALVLLASLGSDEFKLWEVVANIIVLTVMCIIVFKVGLSMNISVIEGIW